MIKLGTLNEMENVVDIVTFPESGSYTVKNKDSLNNSSYFYLIHFMET